MMFYLRYSILATACNKITEFENGVVNYHPDNYFGSQLIYDCNAGFTLVGNKTRVCEGDGWWSGFSPICAVESKLTRFKGSSKKYW